MEAGNSEPYAPCTIPGHPFGGWRHHLCPGGKRVTGFSVAQGLPTNPVPLPPRFAVGLWVLGILGNLSLYQLQRENHTTGLSPWKCTPSAAFGGVSPRESVSHDSQVAALPYESCSLATPEGEILAALCLVILMKLNGKQRANFPLRGKYRRRRG